MNFGQAIASGFRNYVQFRGTASRSEYWWWALFVILVSLVTMVVDVTVFGAEMGYRYREHLGLNTLWSLVTLLPNLAVLVRRLRDAGYRWPWLFLGFIPIVGTIWLIVLLCKPSKTTATRPNQASVPGTSAARS